MALTSPHRFPAFARRAAADRTTCCHQVSGSCSAQPGFGAEIASSTSGEVADATSPPVAASSSAAFIDELPTSNPRRNPSRLMRPLYQRARAAVHTPSTRRTRQEGTVPLTRGKRGGTFNAV